MEEELPERPSGTELGQFHPWQIWVGKSLDILLKPKRSLLSDDGRRKSSIGKLLHRAAKSFWESQEDGVFDLQELVDLIDDLLYLCKHNPKLFETFRVSLTSSKAQEYSWLTGVRFEMRIAKLLTEAEFLFTRPEPPDFKVDINNSTIWVECYAPRALVGTDICRKTRKAIKKKEERYKNQPWTSGSTVLFLDATWLAQAEGYKDLEAIQGEAKFPEEFEAELREATQSTRYDLIIAFWFGHAVGEQSADKVTSCMFSPDTSDPVLVAFKDQLFERFQSKFEEPVHLLSLPAETAKLHSSAPLQYP